MLKAGSIQYNYKRGLFRGLVFYSHIIKAPHSPLLFCLFFIIPQLCVYNCGPQPELLLPIYICGALNEKTTHDALYRTSR